MKFHIVYLQ